MVTGKGGELSKALEGNGGGEVTTLQGERLLGNDMLTSIDAGLGFNDES